MKLLFKEIYKNNKGIFYFCSLLGIFSGMAHISGGVVQKYILDSIVEFQGIQKTFMYIFFLFLAYFFMQIFGALTYYFSTKYGQKVYTYYMRKSLEKFNKVGFATLVDKKQGELKDIIEKGSKALGDIVDTCFARLLQNSLIILFGLLVIFILDIYLFLFFMCLFIPSFIVYSIFAIKKIIPKSVLLNKKENKVSGELVDYFSNIRDARIFGVSGIFVPKFHKKFLSIFILGLGISKKHHYMNFVQFLILIGSMCIIFAYTAYNIILGIFSVGIFILVYYIFTQIRYNLWEIVFLYRNFEENLIKINRLLDFFTWDEAKMNTALELQKFESLSVKKLSFAFDEENQVLKSINFDISNKDKVAIIGKSGQGKTTFINIILGLYEEYQGSILINNKKIDASISHIFSYVPQDVQVFNENLRFNLTLGEKFSDTVLLSMLDKVGLSYLGKRAKKGKTILDIMVGSDGLKLSGGEKQRLGIARAMIRERDIYVFDEITSNLDEETEKDIINLLFKIASHKTFLIISHKKEILKNVDRVYEMNGGKLKIVEKM